MEKHTRISLLLDIYGKILTKRQKETMDLYYFDDLSFNEIGEQLGISKQGVRDNIVNSTKKLEDMEDKLHLLDRNLENDKEINKVLEEIHGKDGYESISIKIKKLLYYKY